MIQNSPLLPPPLGYRKNIPLYYPKTEQEIKADKYEIYNPNVVRSCRNFYEGDYGTKLLSEVGKFLPKDGNASIAELGCGTGYLLGNIALTTPNAECVGLDYSYQMLKMAAQVFKNDKNEPHTFNRALQNGMKDLAIKNHNLDNLHFALSDACVTPLQDDSIDFCFSCFLWDRVGDPLKLLKEKIRITKAGGTVMIISPFNYLSAKGWELWFPIEKIISTSKDLGLNLIHSNRFELNEILDIRSNRVVWEVDSLVFKLI
jgi:SAM-dependent methyltransferase